MARCQSALGFVQHDLDVIGYGHYRVRARFGGWPASVYATLPDGSYWGGTESSARPGRLPGPGGCDVRAREIGASVHYGA